MYGSTCLGKISRAANGYYLSKAVEYVSHELTTPRYRRRSDYVDQQFLNKSGGSGSFTGHWLRLVTTDIRCASRNNSWADSLFHLHKRYFN